jgi:choline dehydrogenase
MTSNEKWGNTMRDRTNRVDILIVGGGSAGAVLAARLTEDIARSVLLLEAGPAYGLDEFPEGVLGAAHVADPGHDWGYTSWGNHDQRAVAAPRGKVLGGSSAVNAAVAIRPRPSDLAKWVSHGAEGWSYEGVLPTFRDLENTRSGDDAYHGRTGPLPIRQRTMDGMTPGLRGFVESAVSLGYKQNDDFNGAEQEGAGGAPVNVVDEVRQNTAITYLSADVRIRPNLTIKGDVNIDRVLLEGSVAKGVLADDGTDYYADEVILSGGTYGSPAILMRSGIGPAGDLTRLGIDVVNDLPVGQRMQDQALVPIGFALAPENLQMVPAVGVVLWTPSSLAVAGELDLNVTATHLLPGSQSPTGGAIVMGLSVTLPESTGNLRLASADPKDAPLINSNYLGTGRDGRRAVEAFKIGRAISRQPAFARLIAGELIPGPSISDDDAAKHVFHFLAPYGHPTSTVPMGSDVMPWAVVDSVGAVKGIERLRVVDASIIPEVPSTVTNLTVIMIAEQIFRRVYR